MTRESRLSRLEQISDLMFDLRLKDLKKAAEARNASLDRLEGLAAAPAVGLDPITSARTDLLYQRWADQRRSDINLVLARQTADWLDSQDKARHAFGRVQVLRRFTDRPR